MFIDVERSLFRLAIASVLAVMPVVVAAQDKTNADIPIKRVVLFISGVAFF